MDDVSGQGSDPGSGGFTPWSLTLGGKIVSRPAVQAGVVCVTIADGSLCAVDATTGEQRWRRGVPGAPIGSPSFTGDVVYAATDAERVCAFDLATGDERWRLGAQCQFEPPAADAEGNLLVKGEPYWHSNELSSIDPWSGEVRWRQTLGSSGSYRSTASIATPVTVTGDVVVVHTGDTGQCFCLDVATGEIRWEVTYGTHYHGYRPATVADGLVYVGSGDGVLHAMDLADGKTRWVSKALRTDLLAQEKPWDPVYGQPHMRFAPSVEGTPLVVDDTVCYVLRNGFVHCLDAKTGHRRWSDLTHPPIVPALTSAGGLLLAQHPRGRIRAWEVRTGDTKWTIKTSRRGTLPVAADDAFYIASGRRLRACELQTGRGLSRLHRRVR